MADALPTGTVTFLLTDVEASTRAWERDPKAMRLAMRQHDEVLAGCIEAHGGRQVESGREGDSVLTAFTRATDALACAVAIQRELGTLAWPPDAQLRVRIALHSGEAEARGGHYYGPAVYRCARLLATGHGGQVLLSRATQDLVLDSLPADLTLRDLGHHRLRDLQRPEQVFQVLAGGLRADFPSLRSLDPRRHNLPLSPSRFIGRAAELRQLRELLASERLVTVTGAGGSGKTRLALQAAAELVEDFPDGVWLVELATLANPDLVARTAAQVLGVQEQPGIGVQHILAAWLADRELLLVLDNCEHLVAAAAELASSILRACPRVRLLATSREALNVAGESVRPLAPLALPEAVELFEERTKKLSPRFHLTDSNLKAVAEICRRVEGIPLAVELTAGQVPLMSPAEILERLQSGLRILAVGSRSAPARHRTLEAAMDWSYRLLTAEEKAVFRRLSVFVGGFTIEAAEAVCGDGGVDSLLEPIAQLVGKSLVTPAELEGQSTRYSMLETLREFGSARLRDQGELDAFRQRHAEYFIELAEKSAARPLVLSDEVGNLRAAFDAVSGESALRLAAALGDFWDFRGDYAEGRARLEGVLKNTTQRNRARGVALHYAGWMAWAQGDLGAAAAQTEAGLQIARELADREREVSGLQQLGLIATQAGDFELAKSRLNGALAIAAELGLERLRILCLWRLGVVSLLEGDFELAAQRLQVGVEVGRRQGDREMLAHSLHMLGVLALWEGRLQEARELLNEGLQGWGAEASPLVVANFLEPLAAVAAAAGDSPRALRLGGAAESLRQQAAVVPLSPIHRELSRRLDLVRAETGGEEAWRSGAQLSREEAVAYALGG